MFTTYAVQTAAVDQRAASLRAAERAQRREALLASRSVSVPQARRSRAVRLVGFARART